MHPSGLKDSTVALLESSGWDVGKYHAYVRQGFIVFRAVYFYDDKKLLIGRYDIDITDDEELIKLLYLKGLL